MPAYFPHSVESGATIRQREQLRDALNRAFRDAGSRLRAGGSNDHAGLGHPPGFVTPDRVQGGWRFAVRLEGDARPRLVPPEEQRALSFVAALAVAELAGILLVGHDRAARDKAGPVELVGLAAQLFEPKPKR